MIVQGGNVWSASQLLSVDDTVRSYNKWLILEVLWEVLTPFNVFWNVPQGTSIGFSVKFIFGILKGSISNIFTQF